MHGIVLGGEEVPMLTTEVEACMPRILIWDEQTVYRAGLRSFTGAEIPRAEVIETTNLPSGIRPHSQQQHRLGARGDGSIKFGGARFPKVGA